MSRRVYCAIVLAVATTLPGCGLMQTARDATRESMQLFRPKPNDYRDMTQESDSEWNTVGDALRSERAIQNNADPFRNSLQTPKARSIERSLGVD
jgi:hypothetical protein